MNFRLLPVTAFALLISTLAIAHDYQVGDVHIGHPYARATVAGQANGAAYLTLENTGDHNDALISVRSPVARSVEIHTMSMTADNVMRMREVPSIELKAKEKVDMLPGDGYHIMLLGLKKPLKAGDKLPLILTFKKAGKVSTSMWVEDGNAQADHTEHQRP